MCRCVSVCESENLLKTYMYVDSGPGGGGGSCLLSATVFVGQTDHWSVHWWDKDAVQLTYGQILHP